MKMHESMPGDGFDIWANKSYSEVLTRREKSSTFKFNGVRVIMFMDDDGK